MENVSNFSQSLPWHMNESLAIPHHHCSNWTTLSTDPVMDVWNLCISSVCLQQHPFLSMRLHLPQDVSNHGKFQGCRTTLSIVSQEHCIPFALKMLLPSALQKGTLQWRAHTAIMRLNPLWSEVALFEEAQVALCSPCPSSLKKKKKQTSKPKHSSTM